MTRGEMEALKGLHHQLWGRDEIEQAKRSLIRLLDQTRWRKVSEELPPKDGTWVLWRDGEAVSCIRWPEYEACFESGRWLPLPEVEDE